MSFCNISEAAISATLAFEFLHINVVTPTIFFVSIPLIAFILIVLLKETATEGAYIYQVLLIAGKALEMLGEVYYTYGTYVAGLGNFPGFGWYKNSYTLMFIYAHFAVFGHQFATYLSLYLAAFMSIDRLWALFRPMTYKLQNRWHYATVAVVLSVLIASTPSVYGLWIYVIGQNEDGSYQILDNLSPYYGRLTVVMLMCGMFLRLFGVVTLLACNLLLVYYFRLRFVKRQQLFSTASEEKTQKRKNKERSLFLLAFWQSAFTCMASTIQLIITGLLAFYSSISCYTDMLAPLDLMAVQLVVFLEMVVPFALNQHLRSVALRTLQRIRPTVSVDHTSAQIATKF